MIGCTRKGLRWPVKELWRAAVFLPLLACAQEEDTADSEVAKEASLVESSTVLYETSKATVLQEGDWIRWRFVEQLSQNPESTIYRGTRAENGECAFQGSGSAASPMPDALIVERTVAMNLNQCLIETERATLQMKDAAARGFLAEDSEGGVKKSTTQVEGGAQLQLQDGYAFTGWIQSRFQDPLTVWVNWVTSRINWSSDGSCIYPSARSSEWWWLSATSWYLQSSGSSGTTGCGFVQQQTSGLFYNFAFCAFTMTWASHNVEFHAYPNGATGWSWSWSKGGLCAWMLSYSNAVRPY